ncbi:putative hydroxypyruvate isomerase [Scaptodrosophila lebanonensis]|uniref:Putative hydroxypyruvate isomerase n=1 Tax=Drosophila lebanonensis TaxID=7225 RepID=A0A6J2TNS4_DROLE|nr:putative hydroxypyruvate isomerase [Scaptodrosophila lebanonensis]XP_030376627.1 putative hydroxypyruvate isomerase [Scaptodrosophila lebanonensis]
MTLRFAANLNFLFTEASASIAEKICKAHKHGFKSVEIPYPKNETEEVVQATNDTGICVSLINISLNTTCDEFKFGTTSIPGAEKLFEEQLDETIQIAKLVHCKKIHLMAGIIGNGPSKEHFKVFTSNLKIAADSLKQHNMVGLIEPINKYAIPNYFLDSYEKAAVAIQEVCSDNIKLMMDFYHLQHIRGNVTNALEEYKPNIGHFQIAQVPSRNEPDTRGELNFGYIFEMLSEFDYDDWIGCEYKPKSTTTEGLKWISKYGLKL